MIAEAASAEFLVRAGATACVVILVALAAARMGPVVGGILVGLPIVLAPAFFFLILDQQPAFVASAAAGALYSLSATQMFVGSYVALAGRLPAFGAILAAIAVWTFVALPLAFLPHSPLAGLVLFAVVTVALRHLTRRYLPPMAKAISAGRPMLVVLRGVAGGLLVGVVTLAASGLGPALAGALVSFPIGFCTVLLSLSLDHGMAIASRTAYAGLLGVTSLAAFCLVLALTAEIMNPWVSFAVSLLGSVTLTALLGTVMRMRDRKPSALC